MSVCPETGKCCFYDKLFTIYPTCPIIFLYQHVRKRGSRKQNCDFVHVYGKCRDCVKVHFCVHDEPQPNSTVTVDVVVSGTCNHTMAGETESGTPTRRGRPLSGISRLEAAKRLVAGASTPTKEFYSKLADMPDGALLTGNTDATAKRCFGRHPTNID